MGFFDSLVRGITFGPAAAFMGKSSGRSNSRPGRVQSEWDRVSNYPGQFDSSGGPPRDLADSGIYDEFGYGRTLPGSHIAPEFQYGSEQVVARRNDALMARGGQQAQAALNTGVENLSRYRPGGAAALLSPYYQSMANAYMQTAASRRTEAPNSMFRYDEQVRKSAEEDAKKAGLIQGGLGIVGTAIGALIGGGAGGGVSLGIGGQTAQGGGNPNQYSEAIGPPQGPGGGQAPLIGPPTAQQAQGGGQPGQGAPGSGGQKRLTNRPGEGGGGFGQGPQSEGGPGGGPQQGGSIQGQGAPGGQPGSGAPGGGGGMTMRYPAAGPVSDHLAMQMGADPGLMAGIMAQVNDPQPDFARVMHARLNLLLAQDSLLQVA